MQRSRHDQKRCCRSVRFRVQQPGYMVVASAAQDDALRVELFAMLEPLLFRCKDLFHEIDADGGGTVSCEELLAAFERKRVAAPAEQVRQLFRLVDANGDGHVEISEFMDEMRRIKLAQRASLSGVERARRLRRASSKREQRRRELNLLATAAAKERVADAPPQVRAHLRSTADETAQSSKLRRQQAAAWQAFERRRADELRWRRSALSSSTRAPGRFIDVDPSLRGVQTAATWTTDLVAFTEEHRETPASQQQQICSLLARDCPTSQAAEIWEQSVHVGTNRSDCQPMLRPEPGLNPKVTLEQRDIPPVVSVPREAMQRHRPASAPAATGGSKGGRRVGSSTSTSATDRPGEDHRLEHDHAESLVERGDWHLENDDLHPGVQLDTGGRTVWIGQLPHTCAQAPHLLQAVLEQQFGTVASLCARTKPGKHKSWALVTFRNTKSAKDAAAARIIDAPGT